VRLAKFSTSDSVYPDLFDRYDVKHVAGRISAATYSGPSRAAGLSPAAERSSAACH